MGIVRDTTARWAVAPHRKTPAARKRDRHFPVGEKHSRPRCPTSQVVTGTRTGVARRMLPEDIDNLLPHCYRYDRTAKAKQVEQEDIGTVCESFFLQDRAGSTTHLTAEQDYWEKKSASSMEHQEERARICHRTARHQEFPRHNKNRFS